MRLCGASTGVFEFFLWQTSSKILLCTVRLSGSPFLVVFTLGLKFDSRSGLVNCFFLAAPPNCEGCLGSWPLILIL